MHGSAGDRRALEREALRNVIAQWNANRLDLFELSEPNEVGILNYSLWPRIGKPCEVG